MIKNLVTFLICALAVFTTANAQDLSPNEITKQRVQDVFDEFIYHLSLISNTSLTEFQRQNEIKAALNLFIGNGKRYTVFNEFDEKEYHRPVTMQMVTSRYSMKTFLKDIYNHRYGKFVIEAADVVYFDNVQKRSDDCYEATAYYMQKCLEHINGRWVYRDITPQKMKIYLDNVVTLLDGSLIIPPKLGDIYINAKRL